MVNRISGTLSSPRYNLAATAITYNGVDYAVFGGGNGPSFVVDFMYPTTENNNIKINILFSAKLSARRSELAATTINYNGVDYAVFGGGSGPSDVVDFMCLASSGSGITVISISGTLSAPR